LVETVERVVPGIESDGAQQGPSGSGYDYNLEVLQPLAKPPREFVENPSDFFSDLVWIHR
jgi:hypothetical protein